MSGVDESTVAPIRHAVMLEKLYERYNCRALVHPDPLELVYEYDNPSDREVVGLIAACLAYGRVAQILRSVRTVLAAMPRRVGRFVRDAGLADLRRRCAGFKHRFTDEADLVRLLRGIGRAVREHGTLRACFEADVSDEDETFLPALTAFSRRLRDGADGRDNYLLPDPRRGSACKRLNLFLRWMVRSDDVDVGAWAGLDEARLLVPLDTHMHRVCRRLGFTDRRQADMRTVLEVTAAFRRIAPGDPVRYDFALTRPGIRGDADWDEILREFQPTGQGEQS